MSTLIYTPFVPKYLSFSDFKWTTTYGCVCRHILECRFTHFAPYVFSGRVRFVLDLFMRYPDGTAPPRKEGNIKIMDYFFEYVGKVRS